jgi:hypothetical protein
MNADENNLLVGFPEIWPAFSQSCFGELRFARFGAGGGYWFWEFWQAEAPAPPLESLALFWWWRFRHYP